MREAGFSKHLSFFQKRDHTVYGMKNGANLLALASATILKMLSQWIVIGVNFQVTINSIIFMPRT